MTGLFPQGRYAHLRLTRVGEQAPRRKRPGRGTYPSREPREQGAQLNASVQGILAARASRRQPAGIDPALILQVRLAAGSHVDADTWDRSGFSVLGTRANNITLLFANEQELASFRQRIQAYSAERADPEAAPRYPWLAAIESVAEWSPDDRRGRTLRDLNLPPSSAVTVDAELWYPGTREQSQERIAGLRQFADARMGRVLDAYIGTSLVLARMRLPVSALDELLTLDTIYVVELPPRPEFSRTQVLNLSVSDFLDVPSPPEDAPSVCILDSGVAAGHGLLGPAVGETIAVPTSLGTAGDVHGHGTMVAGLAIYGNVQQCIERRSFRPQHQLFSAHVTNERNEFDNDVLVVGQTRDAIEYFHNNYGCRVFNLSLGDARQPFDGSRVSAWAAALDELARELDIVIVVSTGNFTYIPEEGDATHKEAPWTDYPDYLFQRAARIVSPSEAVNVLTVGALARPGTSYDSERHPDDPSTPPIAQAYEPSPFTRIGPGIRGTIKPDLAEIGGNVAISLRTGRQDTEDSGVACVSFNREFAGGSLFAFDSGTSFAAPAVAFAAARVLDTLPGRSANLVRALLASAARVPEATSQLLAEDEERILRVCGYGRPNVDAATASTDERVVLFAEETLGADRFHVFEVPLPTNFLYTTGKRYIGVSLAFDPPTRDTRLDYLGTTMDFRLIRGVDPEEITRAYSTRSADDEGAVRLRASAQCVMSPGPLARQGGTLQCAVHTITQNPRAAHGDTYHVVVRCNRIWAGDEFYPQRYALVVTLEHSRVGLPLYAAVRQRTREVERVRIRTQE